MSNIADAYAQGASAWADGPTRVYRPLADLLVAFSPTPIGGRLVLDLGTGTGVGSRAALAAGARVLAADLTHEMLLVDRSSRPPGTVGDAIALPFCDHAFDVVLAAFSLNHLDEPAVGVREAGRVAPLLLASTYADDDDHPVKLAVETALSEQGWQRPGWYARVKDAMHKWGSVTAATTAVERGGLRPVRVERREVRFDDLTPDHLVEWRLGMAQTAPFVASLGHDAARRVRARALELLGDAPAPLVRTVILVAAATE